ncbi:hypothetical protein BpHYR1_024612 [Brachionus plicatilis]|uniref:Uncharacterized protein n=1 Tax=Brachionus plicatilis TaxID=10195 RepID=A0A3M7SRA8_BRAPC|nr:hypothetical protein BpHYR1_024612 [Brachionus plicatilis]
MAVLTYQFVSNHPLHLLQSISLCQSILYIRLDNLSLYIALIHRLTHKSTESAFEFQTSLIF